MLSPHPQKLSVSFSLKPPYTVSPNLAITLTLTLIHSLTNPHLHSHHVMEGGLTYEGAFFAITMEGGLIYEKCWWHNLCHNSPMWWVVVARGVSPSSLHQSQLVTWASYSTSYAKSCGTTLILNSIRLTSKLQAAQFHHQLVWELGFLVVILIGMAIYTRSMGTGPGLTIMDWVSPSPI